MQFLHRTFGAIDRQFLVRAYLIGVALMAFFVWIELKAEGNIAAAAPQILLAIASTILFPFAKLVWNEIRDFLLGSNVFFLNAILMVAGKVVVNLMLWFFAFFIAPVGLVYLWYRTRNRVTAD